MPEENPYAGEMEKCEIILGESFPAHDVVVDCPDAGR